MQLVMIPFHSFESAIFRNMTRQNTQPCRFPLSRVRCGRGLFSFIVAAHGEEKKDQKTDLLY